MKKMMSLFTAIFLIHGIVMAQGSHIFDDLKVSSKILKGERPYSVYLPEGYESSNQHYPILYLLHGGGDDHTAWVQSGEVKYITDKAIQCGKSTQMIIVMPNANEGRRGYFNSPDGKWQYEDFFFEEFIPYIEKTYRVKEGRRYRAIAGLIHGWWRNLYVCTPSP